MNAAAWTISMIAILVALAIAYRWERPRQGDDDSGDSAKGHRT